MVVPARTVRLPSAVTFQRAVGGEAADAAEVQVAQAGEKGTRGLRDRPDDDLRRRGGGVELQAIAAGADRAGRIERHHAVGSELAGGRVGNAAAAGVQGQVGARGGQAGVDQNRAVGLGGQGDAAVNADGVLEGDVVVGLEVDVGAGRGEGAGVDGDVGIVGERDRCGGDRCRAAGGDEDVVGQQHPVFQVLEKRPTMPQRSGLQRSLGPCAGESQPRTQSPTRKRDFRDAARR